MPQKKIQVGDNQFGLFIYSWRNWWFRLFGYGLSTQPLDGHTMLFTERNGLQAAHHVLGQCWKIIKPVGRSLD